MPRDDARRPRPTSLARPARKVATLPGFASACRTWSRSPDAACWTRTAERPAHPSHLRKIGGRLPSVVLSLLPANAAAGDCADGAAAPTDSAATWKAVTASGRIHPARPATSKPNIRTPSRPTPRRAGFDLGRQGSAVRPGQCHELCPALGDTTEQHDSQVERIIDQGRPAARRPAARRSPGRSSPAAKHRWRRAVPDDSGHIESGIHEMAAQHRGEPGHHPSRRLRVGVVPRPAHERLPSLPRHGARR